MPYPGELANKSSHSDIIRNPEIQAFLEGCEYLKPPSDEEGKVMAAFFVTPPPTDALALPEHVIAFDGSWYEASLDDHLPSTKVGYIKIGTVLIDMDKFKQLRDPPTRLVDPFKVAELQRNNSALTFAAPSANMRLKNRTSVRDSFRAMIDEALIGPNTRFDANDHKTSLRTTLFHLAALRTGELGTGDPERIRLHSCPSCGKGHIELIDIPDPQYCQYCKEEVFPSDALRIWEEVTEYQSNQATLNRFMLMAENLLPIHYMGYLRQYSLPSLAVTAFFHDGPLAVFGTSAWLHAAIMRYIHEVNHQLQSTGYSPMLVIGLQKTGQVIDHCSVIDRYIPTNRIFAIQDDYRYTYIIPGRDPSESGFGSETYYGQDFIFKTLSGRIFVFALPFPFSSKSEVGTDFSKAKVDLGNYPELPTALALIKHFELDLYENSVVPIALAHRYTAISLKPGGRVLDLLTKKALKGKT
jgi:hypothetical protein